MVMQHHLVNCFHQTFSLSFFDFIHPGTLDARKAVAMFWSRPNHTLKPEVNIKREILN